MNILFITPDYPPKVRTGIATYVQAMARALVTAGETVHVLTYETDGGPADGADRGVHVHRRSIKHIPGVRRALAALPKSWAESRLPSQAMTRPGRRLGLGITSLVEATRLGVNFDVVESPDYFCPGWAIAACRRWPVLTVLHTPLEVEVRYSNLPNHAYLSAATHLERAAAGLSSAISAPSRTVKTELLSMGWDTVRRASHEPIGIDVHEFPTGSDDGLHTGRILIAGHITPRKGHDVLARAVGRLVRLGRQIEVVCVGSYGLGYWEGRPFRDHLEDEIRRSGAPWRFMDQMDRATLHNLYSTSVMVAVPSRFESFSIVGLEGLLAQKPVLVTDKCGLAENASAADAGLAGMWVVPVDDDEAMAGAIEDILSLPVTDREMVGRAGREAALSFGDVESLVADRLALYRGVA